VLRGRLRDAIAQLNPHIPAEAQEDAVRKVLRPDTPKLAGINRRFHHLLRNGVPVETKWAALEALVGELIKLAK
jgi:type I restriction enzyme R subunit